MDQTYIPSPGFVTIRVLKRKEDTGTSSKINSVPGHRGSIMVTKVTTRSTAVSTSYVCIKMRRG